MCHIILKSLTRSLSQGEGETVVAFFSVNVSLSNFRAILRLLLRFPYLLGSSQAQGGSLANLASLHTVEQTTSFLSPWKEDGDGNAGKMGHKVE